MATVAAPMPASAQETSVEAPARAGGRMLLIVSIVLGLALGGATGVFVLAPMSGTEETAGDSHAAAPAEAEAESVVLVHEVENLVVNPAGTNGQRFLLVTTTVVVRDAAALESVAARDTEVRDRLVDFLSARTVDELSDPSRREILKAELATAVGTLFPAGTVRRVLLPQFVIQ